MKKTTVVWSCGEKRWKPYWEKSEQDEGGWKNWR